MRLHFLLLAPVLAAPLAAQATPGILTTVTNPANGHTYHLLDNANWTDSEAAAVALGGHLATVDDQAENDFLINNFSAWGSVTRHLWIGFNDQAVEGTWVWVDGSPVTYTNWWIVGGAPNNSLGNDPINGEDHCCIYPTGEWEDLHNTNTSIWFPVLNGIVEISGPVLSLSAPCPGPTSLDCANMTPGGPVVAGYSFSMTSSVLPSGACAGTTIPVTAPVLLFSGTADANGDISFAGNAPANACGLITVLAFDVLSCTATNALAL